MDEEAQWSAIPAAAFEDLLRHPFCCGMAGYLDMRNLAVGMADRKENIEGPEPDRPHAEEIAGPDIPGMPQKRIGHYEMEPSVRSKLAIGRRAFFTIANGTPF